MSRIRRADPTDRDLLAPHFEAFFREDAIAFEPTVLRANLAAMLSDDRAAIWIAITDDDVVMGFASATLTRGVEMGLIAEIEDLYVLPGFRRQGLARQLLEAAIAWAEAQGAQEQFVVITPEAEAEQGLTRFYARYGFSLSDRLAMFRSAVGPAP